MKKKKEKYHRWREAEDRWEGFPAKLPPEAVVGLVNQVCITNVWMLGGSSFDSSPKGHGFKSTSANTSYSFTFKISGVLSLNKK